MSLPLATSTWDDKEIQAINAVVESGMFSMGKYTKEFESHLAEYLGVKYCVMVNSGSSANLLAVAALFYTAKNSLKRGDEVIVPAVSWSTTFYPLYQYGLKIKFVDVDLETMNLDLEKLKSAISEKTRLIFSVNLLGNAVDYEALNLIIGDRDIKVLEDNCEALGAKLNDKFLGTFGCMGTLSFYFSHHISTMEGGAIVTDDEELFHILLSIRSHGWTRHLPDENRICNKSDNAFEESFRFVLPGYNLRPLDMSAAVGIEQLKKLPSIVEGRRRNSVSFKRLFADIPGVSIQREVGESSWFGFAIVVDPKKITRTILLELLGAEGIESRPIVAGNFVRNPAVKYFDYEVFEELSNSDKLSDNGLFIGNHHYDINEELEAVANMIKTL